MEDEERQKKLETGKAKLAEYRQRKAHADSQRKKKKKKKSEEDSQGSVEPDRSTGREDELVGDQHGVPEANTEAQPIAELSFSKTLRSGETVKHDQTYTIEPESEVSTTAEDYSSEVNGCREMTANLMTSSSEDFIWEEAERKVMKGSAIQDVKEALAAKTRAVEELSQELEEIRAEFGTEGVQKLQEFEAALKQRDAIITQLTANLQQAREEKDEIMKEFLALTEQSQKLQLQFQQLQAGETLRNTSHSSTAADLLQARQQLAHYQLQLEEANMEAVKNQEKSDGQLELIGQLRRKIGDMESSGRRSEESFTQRLNEKDLLLAEKEKVIMNQDQSLAELRAAEETLATTLKEKNLLLSEQTASLNLFREEIAILGQSANDIQVSDEKDLIIAEQERVISERDCSFSRLEDELESSRQSVRALQQRVAVKESELEKCLGDLQNAKRDLECSKGEMESCKSHLEKARGDLHSCQSELAGSRRRERTSSDEIKQLMGTVEDLQRRCHRDSLSEGDAVQRMQEDTVRKLDLLRAELDEMYGQQIVHMKQELNLQNTVRMEQVAAQHRAEMERHQAEVERHRAEAELLTAQNSTVKETLTGKIQELQATLAESTNEFNRERFNLQAELQSLRGELRSAREKTELVSNTLVLQESQQDEMRLLSDTTDDLRRQLAAAREAALQAEAQHESETTNYKIKLEMLEREKDAVLDRMAESQEAELERLRTQLLFSHEEELTHLREELRRESFLNAENLLNEAASKHQRSLDDLRLTYEDQLHLLQKEKAAFSNEREELSHQIVGLKEDLKLALHSSKEDELVRQLRELQVELEDLRKGGEQRARLESEIQTLQKKMEVLQEKDRSWESKWKARQRENDAKAVEMETLSAQLKEEIEKQRTTFSFAEKNFEVNYQELKEEYSCLFEAKTRLEERTLKEALELRAKIADLEGENVKRCAEAVEKDSAKLAERLNVTMSEKESLAVRLSQVTEQLVVAENQIDQLQEKLDEVNTTRGEDQHAHICSLRGEVEALQSRLKAAEAERDGIRRTSELRGFSRPSPSHVQPPKERPVEGRASPQKPATGASGSNRRKRRQRLKQERRVSSGGSSEAARQREEEEVVEEEEEEEEEEESRATSAAERAMQTESHVRVDVADGCQGDGTSKQVSTSDIGPAEAAAHTSKHGECTLQLEAKRISLTHIHTAQLELVQEEADNQKDAGDQDSEEVQRVKTEAAEQHRHLEEKHRQEVERLQAQYQKSLAETEERCGAEVAMLRRQLQELSGLQAQDSDPHSSEGHGEEYPQELKDLSEEQLSQWASGSRSGLSAKLQALRKALYNEYVQEVAALKEQHEAELTRLRQQLESEGERRDLNAVDGGATSSSENVGVAGQGELQGQLSVEVEVAKAIVQMSVEYAQQTELARINKLSCQASTGMQTQSYGEEAAEEDAAVSVGAWLKEGRERLEKELRDRDTEIRKLREKLRRAELRTGEKPLQMKEDGQEKVEDEEDDVESTDKDNERIVLRRTNERLSRVLADVLKTTAAAEETMGLHMQSLQVDASSSGGLQAAPSSTPHVTGQPAKCSSGDSPLLAEDEVNLMGISGRLQTALEKMLMVITDTTNQVEHARITQTELMRESFRHNQEISELLQKQEELQERLAEEARARERLALELHRAEGLIDGYTGERAALEEQLRQKQELQLNLEQELQVTGSRLQELEQERLQMQEERELVSRQQDAMRETAGTRELCLVEAAMVAAPEADFLEETEKLMKEKVEVQRQAEKESADLLKQMKTLEAELEEQVNRVMELEHARKTETGDLQQQIQALEKQLDKNRRFLDEQAVDREHERDVFQHEIQQLEQQLKNQQKFPGGSEQRSQQVEQLNAVVDKLQQELLHMERKEDVESRARNEYDYDEMKQKMDLVSGEFHSLKAEHGELLETHRRLKTSTENSEDFTETPRQRTAHLAVAQAQAQALEKNGASGVDELRLRVRELEDLAGEKDAELCSSRKYAEELQWKVCTLEEHLREKVAAALVSQATLDALQQQASKDRSGDLLGHLNQKLAELEASLSDIEKNHKLRKQLLSSSKEAQYERRLAALLDLTRQMMGEKRHRTSAGLEASAGDQALTSELQEARNEALAAKKQLDHHMEQCHHLQAELQDKTEIIKRLKEQLEESSSGGDEEMLVLRRELTKTQEEAALAKEELNSCKEKLEKLQELLQERELTIAQLKEDLLQVKAEEDKADRMNLLTELQDIRRHADSTKDELDSSRSHNQKLQEDIHVRELSISKLTEELQEVQKNLDATIEEVKSYKSNNEKLQEDIQLREGSILKLKEELQEVLKNRNDTKEIDSYKSLNEKLQEDAQVHKTSISRLEEKLQEVQKNMNTTKEELNNCKSDNERLQEEIQGREVTISELKEMLQEVHRNVDSANEEASSYKSNNEKLQEDIKACEVSVLNLKQELQEVQKNLDSTKEELNSYKSHNEKLKEDVQVREVSISKLEVELQEVQKNTDFNQELTSYKSRNEKLQEDIQVREVSISKLAKELQELQKNLHSTKEELNCYKSHNEKLQEKIQLREGNILKLKEELPEVQQNMDSTQDLRSSKSHHEEIQLREVSILKLKEELQEVKKIAETTKEELRSSKSHNSKLQDDIQLHEVSISKLKNELREARAALTKAGDSVSTSPSPAASPQPFFSTSSSTSQPKRKASGKQPLAKGTKDKMSLSRKGAAPSRSPELAQADASTQTAANEELDEVMGEFREKVVQMQELHAAEILDMEARHISESDALRRDAHDLEDECKALKAIVDKLRATEVTALRQDRPLSQFKDGYTSDSSSDYSQRTGYDLPVGLQQEFRVTPEGARREADDPVLPDRIKSLLREVHQEGMQVLSLSELPVSENEPGGHLNLQAWLKERDALLATVESLKGLIAHMQTTQVSGDSVDWRAELLEAVHRVFTTERSVFKSALYTYLDLTDTSDAIIHINQLERRMAEQDAHHREALGSLHAADRSSLIAEIHHLRGEMERLYQGARPATLLGATEHRGGGDADGAPRADRLLLEELKGELSQTKLELETTLISQHKHLKELEALRAEVSQKASEVDALNEQLLEESRKGRELQWGMEKERCRAGRNEENAREQLEDLNLALEEQKSQAERLTSTLEQERQVSSRLCQQVEREKLSLHSRLQELQVQLETERAKAREMSSALGTERELRVGGGPASQEENLLEGLQKELDDKQAQVVDLLSQMEAEKLEVLRKDEELSLAGLKTRQNDEALLEARAQLERLEVRLSETQDLLASEEARRRSLEEDKERLEERLAREGGAGRGTAPMPHHQHHPGPWRTADAVLGKLHLVASKIRGMASKAAAEITSEELSLIQSSVDDLISMLQQTPALPSIPERSALSAGSSSSGSSLTERLLRQNAELTGFVGRLTEEKNDLRNHSLRLEEELRYYRHAGDAASGRRGASRPDSADALLLSQQKETWSREKVRLEKALHQALAQVARLRGEIRTDTLRELTGPEADNAALKRMYGRYLRSESFRKSLIYQKKYLLLLLGSFQECEEATLAMLYRMGGRPSEGLGSGQRGLRLRGLMRFRSAVRVSIALSRMRFLVKRWHKTTGMSNTTQKSETTQMITSDDRDYLHPGLDVYRGGSSSRGRSGRESPRSPISPAQHRFLAAGDPGALTCSHLQNYDPDRALTDYISRLEALQRRLGSVTSGASSSLAPLHFGLRR
ncbi:A-kinase anchor protein 9 isoform X2 [Hippocampus comes]|uniref:A-kinase anchor protein 9 isoform X2 n=1 Tax=Hippocampus comes TaxID=109280 RepID=UPI00094E0C6C|nr:PREDICTED: A-kinase anchor protein 9 isoform X2 [Hippocampus comes]